MVAISAAIALESDRDLVAALIAGDRRATDDFVRNNLPWMRSLARRYLRDDALAEDCVQDSLMSAFRALPRFGGQARLKSWLYRIVVNTSLMRLRSSRRRAEQALDQVLDTFDGETEILPAEWTDSCTPLEMLERSEIRAVISHAIGELPDGYRVIVTMRDIDGLDTAEVASALSLSEGNVKVRLHRARNALRKIVEPLLDAPAA